MFEATLQHSYASLPARCVDFLNHIFSIPHLIQTYPNMTSCDAAMHKNISQHVHGFFMPKAHGLKLLMQEFFETLLGKVFQLLGRSAIHLCLPRRQAGKPKQKIDAWPNGSGSASTCAYYNTRMYISTYTIIDKIARNIDTN